MALRVEIPKNPEEKRAFLAGMTDGQRGVDLDGPDSRCPSLEPFRGIYERGHMIGGYMREAEYTYRKPMLQKGIRFRDAARRVREEKRVVVPVAPQNLKDDWIDRRKPLVFQIGNVLRRAVRRTT